MPEQLGVRVSRRAVITTAAATAGAAAAAGALAAADRDAAPPPPGPSGTVPFHGTHQAGIATPQQQYALFAAFDLETADPLNGDRLTTAQAAGNFRRLMQAWTDVAERLTRGRPPAPRPGHRPGVPPDSGIADGLEPSRLTVTFGLGPDLFERIGRRRDRPGRLAPLPAFRGDRLEAAWSGGELLVQICADDPQIVSRAFRAVRSRAPGVARLRWSQQGFLGRFGDATPRNLFGHKDGTANLRPGHARFDRTVWSTAQDDPAWFAGGTYLVFRKIRMDLPKWDTTPGRAQDLVIGRRRGDGAPLSGEHEFSAPDLSRPGPDGGPLIPVDSHVALIRDVPMLRRSYNYDYGVQANTEPTGPHHHGGDAGHHHGEGAERHSGSGHDIYDAGLLFCAYLSDPGFFIRAQRKLAESDRLNAFIRHTGSAVFAVPPGVQPGGRVAAGLFEGR
ncbi:Dyp-type peroxidase [Actinomadura geliboluensis]|uniref:Dyp-type peroxidase n=1 Tax=Actinomadura geliboluensis TaxID=882440 RepID=A0A5S4H7B3_9ACTN|nr:Dyp-type peroxidase [Actinomadura geliboluensis]TMR40644.1 Dyp-type peroxidase [Actinomadura geliboluensis]